MVVTHMGSPPYRAGEGWLSQRPSAWRDRPVPPEPKGSPRCPPKDMGLEVRREELPHKEKEVNSLSSPSQHRPPRQRAHSFAHQGSAFILHSPHPPPPCTHQVHTHLTVRM